MKIGIIGTRGIPNNYGGFEQFAEQFALYLVEKGHEVTVYNSSTHSYKRSEYQGIQLIEKYDPEDKLGTTGQFVYDALCILDSRKRKFDIILQLGYTSSSIFSFLLPSHPKIFTNMDGLEWKRSKYNKLVQGFLKKAEKWAVTSSDYLIADSLGIQEYLFKKYNKESFYVPYGAEIFNNPVSAWIKEFHLDEYGYNLIIARFEPENNIETIINAYQKSKISIPLIIVGNYHNEFGQRLRKAYESTLIRFLGSIYSAPIIDNLRYYSNLYFHGHSVGGTNPSLVEAMGCQSLILAHDNIFNRYILGKDAYYFEDLNSLAQVLEGNPQKSDHKQWLENNLKKLREIYNPEKLFSQLVTLFEKAL